MMFGFTNDDQVYRNIIEFREKALLDGWSIEPVYKNESVETASKLMRDGFKMMIFARKDIGKWKYEAQISIWGPDRMTIEVPEKYNFDEIKSGMMKCHYCLKHPVKTMCVGFCGRCCSDCLPEQKKQQEYPGWCD